MLLSFSDAMVAAMQEWIGADPSLRDAAPRDMAALTELARNTFGARLDSLGISQAARPSLIDKAVAGLSRLSKYAESPIERALAPWLVFENWGPCFQTVPPVIHCPREDPFLAPGDLAIVPQMELFGYRLDFAVVAFAREARWIVAVECDGAEYHDVAKDRERDAYLASFDIPTVRAPGAMIYREPHVVSGRVVSVLLETIG